MPKPFLKWVGGKSQILEEVLDRFPTTINNYYEPFLGGGSVLIGLLTRLEQGTLELTGTITVADVNPHLIDVYTTVRDDVDGLVAELDTLGTTFQSAPTMKVTGKPRRKRGVVCSTLEEAQAIDQEEVYYYYRQVFNTGNTHLSSVHRSALFIALNKTCFRGVYREGRDGSFNVPFGNYKSPQIVDVNQIRQLSDWFTRYHVQFICRDFRQTPPLLEGDFTYIDSPYYPEKVDSFVGYVGDGFGQDKHDALVEWCSTSRGKWLQSNASVPYILEAYGTPGTYGMHELECKRAIHSKKPGSTTHEVLITNF